MSGWTWPACVEGSCQHEGIHTRPSTGTTGLQGGGCAHSLPELVVSVAHLVRTELGDEDLDDADEDEEVDLQWSGEP